jgi:hypothetical protein
MKRLRYILLSFVALSLLTFSCVDPFDIQFAGSNGLPVNALIFTPGVQGATLITKAASDGDPEGKSLLGEISIESLDIFVYEAGENTLFKGYHFLKSAPSEGTLPNNVIVNANLATGTDLLLESNWETQGYKKFREGSTTDVQKYDIFVIANSRMADATRWGSLARDALLGAISTDSQSIKGDSGEYDLYDVIRLKGEHPSANDYDTHIPEKDFLMDGSVMGWSIDPTVNQQYFNTSIANSQKIFSLERAAAKFQVNLTFDKSFLQLLKNENTTITAAPQFKFSNFMPFTYEISPMPGTSVDNANLFTSDCRYDFTSKEVRQDNGITVADYGHGAYTYKLTTYSYSYKWSDGAGSAPALILSAGYKKGDKTEYNYYRIPLVDVEKISSIDRNHYYLVDAVISTKGGAPEDIVPMDVKLSYQVIPWSFNAATDVTEVEGAELLYFTADKTYTLRGDNVQPCYLDYFTPKSELTGGHYLYEPILSNVHVYYKPDVNTTTDINTTGSNPGSYSNEAREWTGNKASSGESVTIKVQPDPNGGGKVYVTSRALDNRAVKYIEFDASVEFEVPNLNEYGYPDGTYTTTIVTHHYIIKHFPLDNIQSVTGSWSSRTSDVTASAYSYSFVNRTGYSLEPSGTTHYFTYQEYRTYGNTYITRTLYSGEVSGLDYTDHNSEQNGIYVTFTDGSKGNCWRERSWNSYDYYIAIYTNRNRMYRRAYDHHWIDWDTDQTGSFSESDAKLTYDGGRFVAKVFDASAQQVFPLVASRTGSLSSQNESSYSYSQATIIQGTFYFYSPDGYVSSGNNYSNLTNNHMYVIQISKAGIDKNGDPVIIGRPLLDNNSQSNDNVVSPAFMIASQLGAVTSYTQYTDDDALAAAIHCRTYMEVGTNGRRFTGWRLPTQAEIKYIVEYQANDKISGAGVFEDVLKGGHYYTLNYLQTDANRRRYTDTNYYTDYGSTDPEYDDTYAVRCIRDLTPEEVAELNSTGTITTATATH